MQTFKPDFHETPEWVKGDAAQRRVAELLREDGWYTLPSYDYQGEENKAPRLEGKWRIMVIPDIDICRDGDRRWAEVKYKEHADWTKITQRYEHGIPRRHYDDYLEVQKQTGTPVYLFIYEGNTGELLYERLDLLPRRFYTGDKMSKGGMVFFPRDAFLVYGVIPIQTEVPNA